MTLQSINQHSSSIRNKVRAFFYKSNENIHNLNLVLSIGENIFEKLEISKQDRINIFYDDENVRNLFIKKYVRIEGSIDKTRSYVVSHSGHTYKIQKRFYLFEPSPAELKTHVVRHEIMNDFLKIYL